MFYWTIQKNEIIDKIKDKKIIYPKIEEYKDSPILEGVYSLLLRNYNKLNNSLHRGLIFGFHSNVKEYEEDESFETIEQFYKYIKDNYKDKNDFIFWGENWNEYSILKVKATEGSNCMPVIFKDLITIYSSKLSGENVYNEETEVLNNINKYMKAGRLNPFSKNEGLLQIHQPFLKEEDIIEIHPNIKLI